MRHDAPHNRGLLSLFVVVGAVAVLAGCGGGSSTDKHAQSVAASPSPSAKSTKASDGAEAGSGSAGVVAPAASKPGSKSQSPTGTKSHGGNSASDKRSSNSASDKRSRNSASRSGTIDAPGYAKLVDNQSARPKSRFTPCNLVSKAQAQAIIGAPLVDPFEAPQGPTCIYRTTTGNTFITLAVQSVPFKQLKRHIRNSQRVAVWNRDGYCGKFGQSMMYVPLSSRRVLSVAAPCALAKQFAAKALRHL